MSNGEDNDAEDIKIKLARNCSFYLKHAKRKMAFLREEAQDPFMSLHNLGNDFRNDLRNKIIFPSFETFSSFSPQKYW